ncbi:hypothetical protein H2200_012593 [Cladophialophora chaetospira]|uniref:Uncharacterized protein n=1 Tax=Cladophialophora chaetospira TaxID=386627 RepID=A0AA38WX84_9EURO|nr:hypothetical protein H2200_012593 [Cladophialophora chaetospira]
MASDNAVQANRNLLSRLFRRGSKDNTTLPDTASTTSETTLVAQNEAMKPSSNQELASYDNLLAKADSMTEAEFKEYLQKHKEQSEAAARKEAGEGWIKKDEKGQYDVIPALHNFVSE